MQQANNTIRIHQGVDLATAGVVAVSAAVIGVVDISPAAVVAWRDDDDDATGRF